MRALSSDLLENLIAAPQDEPEERDASRLRLAKIAGRVYEEELTPRQKNCVYLCVICGESTVEAGRALGISPQAVSVHVKKGMDRMGRILRYCIL